MATYPGAVWDKNVQDTSNDGPADDTVAQAADYNESSDEVAAIETELGTGASPNGLKGSVADLKTRLAQSLNPDGSYKAQIIQLTVTHALLALENCAIVSNVGAAAAPSTRPGNLPTTTGGLEYKVVVGDVAGLRITATNGAKIQMGSYLSAANGYVESTDLGASFLIVSVSAALWICMCVSGIWNVDGA